MTPQDVFDDPTENAYYMYLILFADEGYEFAQKPSVTFNAAELPLSPTSSDGTNLYIESQHFTVKGPDVETKAKVTFQVVNGTWDGKDSADKTVTVSMTNGKGRLTADQVPTGMVCKSPDYYAGQGLWLGLDNKLENPLDQEITGDMTLTYWFKPADFFRIAPDRLKGGGRVEIRLGGQFMPFVTCDDPSVVITPVELKEDYAVCYADLPDVTKDYIFVAQCLEFTYSRVVSVTASDAADTKRPETTYTLNFISGVPGVETPPSMTVTTTDPNAEFRIPEGPSRPGYKFFCWRDGLETDSRVIYPGVYYGLSSDEPTRNLYAQWWSPDGSDTVEYTVKHMQEMLGAAGTFEVAEVETLSGKAGENTAAAAKTYEGFTAQPVTQVKIDRVGLTNTVVEVRYTRNIHELTWDLRGGTAPEGCTKGQVPFGTPIVEPVPTREGFTFDGWTTPVAAAMPDADVTYTAGWKAVNPDQPDPDDPTPASAGYTVRHMQEKLGTAGTFEQFAADNLTGIIGQDTAARAKTHEGFTAQPVTQAKIRADGSTVVEIRYTRNIHTLTFDANGGLFEGSESVKLPFGTPITAPKTVRDGFNFDGWKPAVPQTMPDRDVTCVAQWTTTVHTHTLTRVEGCEPTPGSDGWKPYYACSCGRFFADKDAKKEITSLREWKKGDGKIPALGYAFLDGMNSTWKKDSRKDLVFRANGDIDCFVSIEVDGNTVDRKYYSVESGSTIVKLKHGYLQELKVGEHILTANFIDGECETRFHVAEAPRAISPKTGDESHLLMWSLISMVSLTAAIVVSLPRKKHEN